MMVCEKLEDKVGIRVQSGLRQIDFIGLAANVSCSRRAGKSVRHDRNIARDSLVGTTEEYRMKVKLGLLVPE